MTCEFSLAHYGDICSLLEQHEYRAITYAEDAQTMHYARRVILRHDIDQSLERAVAMAEVEAAYELRATYFVWMRSPFYNCWDPAQSRNLKRLHELGHAIGLHFDETAYSVESLENLVRAMEREAGLLSDFFEIPIDSVSFHRPSAWVLGSQARFGRLINAYNTRFFQDYRYVSDSRRQWKNGCACSIIPEGSPQLHLLTHAFWWTENATHTVDRHILEFLQDRLRNLDREMEKNISAYRRFFGP